MRSLFILGAILAAIVAAAWWRVQRRRALRRGARLDAMHAFPAEQAQLELALLPAANATGKPRGLRWTSCRLNGPPTFAVDRANGSLYALVAATVAFEAIEGGGMEEVEAVGNLRAATAVFEHRDGGWITEGRVVFNLDPGATLQHYHESLALFVPEKPV